MASYGMVQNSVWWRTRGEMRDDFMWERSHPAQKRLSQTSGYFSYIRTFLNDMEYVGGTSSARLSLEYLKRVQDDSGFIPHSETYLLEMQNETYELAESLIGKPTPAGWDSCTGVFQIVMMMLDGGALEFRSVYDDASVETALEIKVKGKQSEPLIGAFVKVYKEDVLYCSGYTGAYGEANFSLSGGQYRVEMSKEDYLMV
ncbi:MAG: hypothetical protein J7L90_02450 [Dehalococcoidia bacterium]|nr:hypothetical protein [Dehalococcoidia bacterium]